MSDHVYSFKVNGQTVGMDTFEIFMIRYNNNIFLMIKYINTFLTIFPTSHQFRFVEFSTFNLTNLKQNNTFSYSISMFSIVSRTYRLSQQSRGLRLLDAWVEWSSASD